MAPSSFLETPLANMSGVGPRLLSRLERLGLHTVRDLLWHFPTRYEDYSEQATIGDLAAGMQATITAEVESIATRHSWRRHLTVTEALLVDDTDSIRAVWFNQPYMEANLPPGTRGSFAGKIANKQGEPCLTNPAFERGGGAMPLARHTSRLVPVYPETRGLTSKWLRHLILPLLERMPLLEDALPQRLLLLSDYPAIDAALRAIHFPSTRGAAEHARERFVFEELFLLQLYNLQEKQLLARENAPELVFPVATMKKVLAGLPFDLTVSQKKALWEIMQDLEKKHPMNRLLQGDVGSGKTIVAVLASLIAQANGFQVAFMAPTEVLARQHFLTYQRLYPHLEKVLALPSVGLIARGNGQVLYPDGLVAKDAKVRHVRERSSAGAIGVLIGTHTLIHGEVPFKKLGLVIIDEQQRFGVKQRQALARRGKEVPHFLSMSATPIPRTIMMTAFGDLTTSRITEMPKDRKSILTKIIGPKDRAKAYAFIRQEVAAGRQAFVICPRVDPPDAEAAEASTEQWRALQKLDAKSVKEEYDRLRTTVFPRLRLGMLHGAMASREKESVMHEFREGIVDVLVATSVIEVGIDVPNATVMMIENAEQFGLAQLYQFRGRVGRGEHQSHCLLFTESEGKTALARLKAVIEAKNGFELAERDLKLRGPGEFLGRSQAGVPDLAMQHLSNEPLVKKSREAAVALLKSDPSLKAHPLLVERLHAFRANLHRE